MKYVLLANYALSSPSSFAHDWEGLTPDHTNHKSVFVYAFAVGEYDVSKPLIIDPTLGFSTYFKGGDQDSVSDIAVDKDGAIYLTGRTFSLNFYITDGSFQTTNAGDRDVFITKINAGGTGLVYSTYLGGSGIDEGYGIAVDLAGNACVTGYTNSSDFPILKAVQPVKSGSYDSFITKIGPDGSALIYSTFLGGSGC